MSDNYSATKTLEISSLAPYAEHPFKLYEGKRFDDMVRSIKELGVLVPIIVRPIKDEKNKFEILSGHNRVNASKTAGLIEISAIVKNDMSDDETKLIVTESNLVQRAFGDLSHSERAIALKTHMDAIKKQGKRNDLIAEVKKLLKSNSEGEADGNTNGGLIDHKSKSRDKTAAKYGLDARTVSRYIRIAELTIPLQNRIDNDEFGIYPVVSISYLTDGEQNKLEKVLAEGEYKLNMKKAEILRSLSKQKDLGVDKIRLVLSDEYGEESSSKRPAVKIKHDVYSKYFSEDVENKEIEEVIEKALEMYFTQNNL